MRLLCVILLSLLLSACGSRLSHEREMLSLLVGKEIIIPENLTFSVMDKEVDIDFGDADFTIITYIDSAGCTPCKMKLPIWDNVINEFKANDSVTVDFAMIINSPKTKKIDFVLRRDDFGHPVCMDSLGAFIADNSLPEDEAYHTLLLDFDRKIIAVGNPAINPKIREVYRQAITGTPKPKTRMCTPAAMALGAVTPGDTIERQFQIVNSADTTLTVQEIVPSCDCTSAIISNDSILSGAEAVVTVKLIADSTAGAFSRYVDVFFNERNNPERLTLHGFIIN